MSMFPFQPHFKSYGRSEGTRQRAAEFNNMAVRIVDRLHQMVLANPDEFQSYDYFEIGRNLGIGPD